MAERVFLGWERPGLWTGAEYLIARYTRGGCCDLGRITLVVPGGRAQRRLLDVLARRVGHGVVLIPPRMVTPGGLFEELCPPARAQAGALETELAWRAALLRANPERLRVVLPYPPEPGDFPAWLGVARDCARLHSELAGAGWSFSKVAAYCRSGERAYCDAARWDVLAELFDDYLRLLDEAGRDDRHEARRRVLDEGPPVPERQVVLFCAPDLNDTQRRLLRACGDRVTVLVQAPESHAAGFDDLGCFDPSFWSREPLPLEEGALRIVERPRDQAAAVLDALAELDGGYPAEEVVVGLGDPLLGPSIERALALAGVPVRSALGTEAAASGPALLLGALADYLDDGRMTSLATLLRHPDLEPWLARAAAASARGGSGAEAARRVRHCLERLDRYCREHLPGRAGAFWAETPEVELLRAVHAEVEALVAPLRTSRLPLPEWSAQIAGVLSRIYGRLELDRGSPTALRLIRALEAVTGLLREQSELVAGPLAPELDAGEALRLTLGRLPEALPEEGGEPAVELLGWLELYLDDAPVLTITGMNEGHVPESVNGDAFLPDGLRAGLGLADNRRRFARDALMLRTVAARRPVLRLIAGRRGEGGEPLAPSRLLFACDDRTVVARALAFYGEETGPAGTPRPLLLPGRRRAVGIPRPRPDKPLGKLPVTAFRDYLACPYRFYLRHILRLEGVEEALAEMDGARFGHLAHAVLDGFARGEGTGASDVETIRAALRRLLEREAARAFGTSRPAAVEVQLHQLGRRLDAFAAWQAQSTAEGWAIRFAEQKVEAEWSVDGIPFTLHGRIDRIDYHAGDGRWRIIDYKTSDSASPPEKTHRAGRDGARQWVDLQLPLYRRLAAALRSEATALELGYVLLPKELGKVQWQPASWSDDELQAADAEAERVIRAIRSGVFWPPNPAIPRYPDGLGGLCLDRCVDRQRQLGGEAG